MHLDLVRMSDSESHTVVGEVDASGAQVLEHFAARRRSRRPLQGDARRLN